MVTLARLLGLGFGFLAGIVFHEYAHAKAADMLGDKYPRMQGRVTLKPKAHLDPVGSLAMPGLFMLVSVVGEPFRMMFGYGKRIEYNPRSLRNPKRDQILIACAGMGANLVLAAGAGFLAQALSRSGSSQMIVTAVGALAYFMSVNVFILVVNVLPIPPLDGSKILGVFLSDKARLQIEEYAQYLLLFLLIIFFFLQPVIGRMAAPICRAFLGLSFGGCPL